jgi:hypothetical protein
VEVRSYEKFANSLLLNHQGIVCLMLRAKCRTNNRHRYGNTSIGSAFDRNVLALIAGVHVNQSIACRTMNRVANKTPVLLLGYNRPQQMRGLIQSLAPLKPKLLLLAVDGPKNTRSNDVDLVRQTQNLVSEITWDAEIQTRFRDSNLGLRKAVVDAVTWANSEYGQVIVLEDDVRAGPQLLDFLNYNLNVHQENAKIAHINGYNLVPEEHLTNPEITARLSIYPESYAWATWERAWQKYDDNLTWAKNASVQDIKRICGSTIGALRWKQNFGDAAAERIDTWAYRWLASMWEHEWLMVSPNRNIAIYEGSEQGTHTRTKQRRIEPSIVQLVITETVSGQGSADLTADKYLGGKIFSETPIGLVVGALTTLVLHLLRRRRQYTHIR